MKGRHFVPGEVDSDGERLPLCLEVWHILGLSVISIRRNSQRLIYNVWTQTTSKEGVHPNGINFSPACENQQRQKGNRDIDRGMDKWNQIQISKRDGRSPQ